MSMTINSEEGLSVNRRMNKRLQKFLVKNKHIIVTLLQGKKLGPYRVRRPVECDVAALSAANGRRLSESHGGNA